MNGIFLFSMPGTGEWLVVFMFGIVWLWALIDCLQSSFKKDSKLMWILLILCLPFLGAVLYFVIGRGRKASTAS